MPATNDTINNSTSYPVPHGTVGSNSPTERSKKARMLDMSPSHRFGTSYGIESVMLGSRGKEQRGQVRYMNGREQISMSETAKHGKLGNTPLAASVGV